MSSLAAPTTAPYVSKLQASEHLQISAPLVLKALHAGLLYGPVVNGAPKVDSASLTAALAKPPTSVAAGDVVFHVAPLALDHRHAKVRVRSHSGWHAQDSMKLTKRMRRRAWTGCWNLGRVAPELVGSTVAADVSGFVVDEAVIVDYELCPVDGLVNFIVSDVHREAAKYLGCRIPVARGSLWARP